MRIVNRKEFLAIEGPVLFRKCDSYPDGDLCVKTSNMGNDFVYFEVAGFESNFDSDIETFKAIVEMLKDSSKSLPLEVEVTSRDGFFNEEEKYLIYEKEDVKLLIDSLSKLLL